ncbi:MAG: hypothetical protein GY705_31965 [Bacteroidetes bacterium]|nr:hypothetical protein [Bacteroidota bacterium]
MRVVRVFSELEIDRPFAILKNECTEINSLGERLDVILRYLFPEHESQGIVERKANDETLLISIVRKAQNSAGANVLFILNLDFWGSFNCFEKIASEKINWKKPSVKEWQSYKTSNNRRAKNKNRWPFLTGEIRVTRLSISGLGSCLPTLARGNHVTRKYRYGFKYRCYDLIDDTSYHSTLNALSDDSSKNLYKILCRRKPIRTWQYYQTNIGSMNQYFDYIQLDSNSVVINCGVHSGAEIPFYLSYNVKTIYHIDPTEKSYLSPYTRSWLENSSTENIFVGKLLYNKKTFMEAPLEKEQVNIDLKKSDSPVKRWETTTLMGLIDDYNINKIDLIKTDIEGAEQYILEDLIEIMKTFKPQVSISIYHTKNQFIDIPSLLIEKCDEYKFFLGHYSDEANETILYCIPKIDPHQTKIF